MKMTITFQHLNQDDKWPHFAWSVSVNGELFSYKTGIGHAYMGPKQNAEDVLMHDRIGYLFPKRAINRGHTPAKCYAVAPKQDDVLQALFSDAEFGAYSFDEFCDNLGYSNDSLKGFRYL